MRTIWATVLVLGTCFSPSATMAFPLCPEVKTAKGSAAASLISAYRRHPRADRLEKIEWLAERGNGAAMNYLGVVHNKGKGVPISYVTAADWWLKGAEAGDPTAQCNLGIMYMHGQGLEQNDVEAYKWFNIASAHGSGTARRKLASMETWRMSRNEVTEAQRLAAEWEAARH